MGHDDSTQRRQRGRPAVSTREEIERIAMRLFLDNGYEATTIQMIAEACGMSRSSVFRYWGSKAEIVWAVFDVHTKRLGTLLHADSTGDDTMTIVLRCVVENMRLSTQDSGLYMERFAVLDSAPELRSEESAHWISWASTVAAFVSERTELDATSIAPESIGGAVQAAFLTVLRRWLDGGTTSADSLMHEIDAALRPLCSLLQHWLDEPDRY